VPDAPTASVELLGPVRLLVDGTPCNLGGPRPRALVARLALSPRTLVPAAELATALWGAQVPPSAGQTLRTYVSRLRAGPLAAVLQREGPGWRLDLPDDAVDAVRFWALLQEAGTAGPAQEADLLRAALALWRGEALADVRDAAFAADEARRLAEARAAAQERLAELRLAAGEHRALVAELTAVVAAWPHREAPALLLATALARSGRASDAADVLAALRRRLADDLGLDPSHAVDALQQQLLVHDPALQAASVAVPREAVPAQHRPAEGSPLPLPLTPFVGREAELAAVDGALARSRLVTLTGPGGSGKTRVALEALRRLDRTTPGAPEAVWLVELGGTTDPALLLDTVAQALGVMERTMDDAALVRALDGRRALLVLDTCEHLADPVAHLVERLLAGCAGLQVLATSREALGRSRARRCCPSHRWCAPRPSRCSPSAPSPRRAGRSSTTAPAPLRRSWSPHSMASLSPSSSQPPGCRCSASTTSCRCSTTASLC
jgi:DNA-binding SARP family transcriptional activator